MLPSGALLARDAQQLHLEVQRGVRWDRAPGRAAFAVGDGGRAYQARLAAKHGDILGTDFGAFARCSAGAGGAGGSRRGSFSADPEVLLLIVNNASPPADGGRGGASSGGGGGSGGGRSADDAAPAAAARSPPRPPPSFASGEDHPFPASGELVFGMAGTVYVFAFLNAPPVGATPGPEDRVARTPMPLPVALGTTQDVAIEILHRDG